MAVIEIKDRWNGNVLYAIEAPSLKEALERAVADKADLRLADLRSADLRSADLHLADLRSANLRSANLRSANLRSADLSSADLSSADLSSADLSSANLSSADLSLADLRLADLSSADLSSADLSSANLRLADLSSADLSSATLFGDDTVLDTGETWKEYVATVVPALLTAGGRTLAEVLATNCWDCHSWDNCPMATAFGVHSENACPVLLRPRVAQFVRFFDAKLIPCPKV